MAFLNSGALTNPDPSLPVVLDYTAVLGAAGILAAWMVPDSSRATLASGAVAAVTDRSVAGKNYAQATAAKQPPYTASAIAGRPALEFNEGGSHDKMVAASVLSDVTGDLGLACVIRPTLLDASGRVIIQIGTTNRLRLYQTNAGGGRFFAEYGGGGNVAQVQKTPGAGMLNTAYAVVLGWDNTAKTLSFSLDGGATWETSAATAAAPIPDTADLYIGDNNADTQGWRGQMADAAVMGWNPLAVAQAARLANLKSYFSNRYLLPS